MNPTTIVRKCFRTELGSYVDDLEKRWNNGIGVRCFASGLGAWKTENGWAKTCAGWFLTPSQKFDL